MIPCMQGFRNFLVFRMDLISEVYRTQSYSICLPPHMHSDIRISHIRDTLRYYIDMICLELKITLISILSTCARRAWFFDHAAPKNQDLQHGQRPN